MKMAIIRYLIPKLRVDTYRHIRKSKETDWFYDEILGNLSTSYEFCKEDNTFVLDIEEDNEMIILYKLFVKDKGHGLGTMILELLKTYCDRYHKRLYVVQVINPAFFQKFKWLSFDGENTFEYKPQEGKR